MSKCTLPAAKVLPLSAGKDADTFNRAPMPFRFRLFFFEDLLCWLPRSLITESSTAVVLMPSWRIALRFRILRWLFVRAASASDDEEAPTTSLSSSLRRASAEP